MADSAERPESSASDRALLGEAGAYALVEVAQQALAMIALPVFFFFLTVDDFGIITEALVLSQIGLTVSTLGLDFSVMRMFFRWPEEVRGRTIAGVTLISVVWSVVLGVALHAALVSRHLGTNDYWALTFGGWAGLLLGIRGVPLAIVRVTGALKIYGIFVLGGALLQVVLQIACVAAHLGPAGYMLGYAAGAGLSCTIAVVAVRREYRWDARVWRLPAETVRYTASVLPSVLFSRFIAVADRVLLARFGTQEMLGLYGAASRFTTPLKFLSGGFKLAIVPLLSREERSGDTARVFERMARFIVLGMLLVGTTIAIAVWCIQFTPWASASTRLQELVGLLLFAQFLSGLTFLGQVHFYYSPRPGAASLSSGLSAAVLVGGLAWLVPRQGALGAAIAAVASGLVGFLVVLVCAAVMQRHFRPWSTLLVLLATFLPCAGASWFLGRSGQLMVFALTLAAYAGSLWVMMRGFGRGGLREVYGR
jgi:O-antigen/teichoic acid export membrane protein